MSTVLFVTHDADLRAVGSRVLLNAGYQVTPVAHAGHASLACMEREPFDVVVVEDQMADGSGASVVERLRRYCPGVRVVRMCDDRPSTTDGVTLMRPFIADDLIGAVAEATRCTRRGATTR
jgi:CheY-like chemotaxis protein